jgi:hypothetical protein
VLIFLHFLAPGSRSGIRISNADPDPDPQSRRIRIHNPGFIYSAFAARFEEEAVPRKIRRLDLTTPPPATEIIPQMDGGFDDGDDDDSDNDELGYYVDDVVQLDGAGEDSSNGSSTQPIEIKAEDVKQEAVHTAAAAAGSHR